MCETHCNGLALSNLRLGGHSGQGANLLLDTIAYTFTYYRKFRDANQAMFLDWGGNHWGEYCLNMWKSSKFCTHSTDFPTLMV